MRFIEPKEIIVDDANYIISKFPATIGREIVARYAASLTPGIGSYKENEEIMFKLMCYVAKPIDGREPLVLNCREMIDNHVRSLETLAKIEDAVFEYNLSFFPKGGVLNLLKNFLKIVPPLISKISNLASALSLPIDAQPSTNSEQSTH
jgi:hypothetical protein